ncbi:hypothetical protein CTI14_15810 [Methylobacterium radiotolerans]|nr:hypothetical protein CTI14_15810 [Methylobacterium radiotolerans]
MRIHIATDHAGLEFSTRLQEHLRAAGHEVIDHGPVEYDALDDYPAFCIKAALAVVRASAPTPIRTCVARPTPMVCPAPVPDGCPTGARRRAAQKAPFPRRSSRTAAAPSI